VQLHLAGVERFHSCTSVLVGFKTFSWLLPCARPSVKSHLKISPTSACLCKIEALTTINTCIATTSKPLSTHCCIQCLPHPPSPQPTPTATSTAPPSPQPSTPRPPATQSATTSAPPSATHAPAALRPRAHSPHSAVPARCRRIPRPRAESFRESSPRLRRAGEIACLAEAHRGVEGQCCVSGEGVGWV
jgi:hypothetical protein